MQSNSNTTTESTVAKPSTDAVAKAETELLPNIEKLIERSKSEIGQLLQVDEMIYFTSIAPLISDFMSTPSDIGKFKKLIAFLVMNFNALFIFNVVMSIAIMNDDLGGTIITMFNEELAKNPQMTMKQFYPEFENLSKNVREAWTISQEWQPDQKRSLGENMKSIITGGGLKFSKEAAKEEKEALLQAKQQKEKEEGTSTSSKVLEQKQQEQQEQQQGSPQAPTSIAIEEHFKKLLELMDEYRGVKGSYNKWYEADKFQYQFKIGRDYDLSKDDGNLPNNDDIIHIFDNTQLSLISGTYFKKDDNKYYNYKEDADDKKKIHEIIIYKGTFAQYIFSYDGLKFSTKVNGDEISIKHDVMNKPNKWISDETVKFSHKKLIADILAQLGQLEIKSVNTDTLISIDEFKMCVRYYVEKNKSKLPDINDKTKMFYESVRNTYRISMLGIDTSVLNINVNNLENYKYCKNDIAGNYTLQYDNKKGLPYFKNNDNTTTLTFDTFVLCGDIFNDKKKIIVTIYIKIRIIKNGY